MFMCKDPSCHQHQGSKAFRVLRCQLPRENDFYKRDTDHTDFVENQDSENEGASTSNCQNSDSQETKSDQTMCKEQSEIDGDTGICGTNQTTDITTDKDRLSTEKLGVAEETAESSNAVLDASSCSEKKVTTNLLAIEEVYTRRNLSSTAAATVIQSEVPSLCVVCGCLGSKKCGRCRQPHYCSREHQTHDWKNGHKLFCSDMASGKCTSTDTVRYNSGFGILLPEFEIITETEPGISEQMIGERSEEERMEDYLKFVRSGKCGYEDGGKKSGGGKVEKTLEKAKSDTRSDKYFNAFKKRVALEPEQVKEGL